MYYHFNSPTHGHLCVQGLVDAVDQPLEHAFVHGLAERSDGVDHLLSVAALLHVLVTHTDAGADERLEQVHRVDAEQVSHLVSLWGWGGGGGGGCVCVSACSYQSISLT